VNESQFEVATMQQLSTLKWEDFKDAKMEIFWGHWSQRAAHAACVFTEKQMKSMLHNQLKGSQTLKPDMLRYRDLPEASQTYEYLCNMIKMAIKEKKLEKQTALEQRQMDTQKVLAPKDSGKHHDGAANAAEAEKKKKGKGKGKKDDGTPNSRTRGRSSDARDPKALAAAAGDDESWKEVRSKSAVRRAKQKEKLALAAEGGKVAAPPKGAGRDGAPRPKTRLCHYFQTATGCNKTAEECSYLHKKGSKKEIEEMEAAKAAGKGKAARAGSPAPGGKKKGGKGAKNGALAANATVDHTIIICPLGDDCLDSACWRTKNHVNSAYIARDGPLFPDEYYPMEPGLEASEQ
jgi:hypothetical protein